MAKILTLTSWFPPHSRGGYEAVCHDVMTALAERGHVVEVLCSNDRLPDAAAAPDPFPVHRALRLYWRDEAPWRPSLRTQLEIERHNQQALRTQLQRFAPDVVAVWHMGAISLSLLSTIAELGLPTVFAVHDDWLTYGLALDPWSGRWTGHRLGPLVARLTTTPTEVPDLGAAGTFTFVSAVTRDRSEAASPWHVAEATVIHAGIDRNRYPPARDSGADVDPWRWRLLYMGRLDPRKGIETVIRALAHLPEAATLALVGRGDAGEQARLEALAAECGVAARVTFSWVERAETPAVYLAHDCVVFPSEWDEPFGLVPLEAMACGLPVVATATGGTAEFLTEGANFVRFASGDPDALAAAVQRVAEDPALRATLRANGWVTAERLDVIHMVDAYERLYLDAADRGARPLSP
jgi:glycosyltransferase involved in cell wall biosynthesis